MIEWIKPSGLTIATKTDKQTIAYCAGLGWKLAADAEEPKTDDITVDAINKMRSAGLKKLIKAENLTVDGSLSVVDMRNAVIDALFEPE